VAGCTPSPDWDRRAGAAYSTMVASEMGLVNNPSLERYIAAVGQDEGSGEITRWELDEYLMYH